MHCSYCALTYIVVHLTCGISIDLSTSPVSFIHWFYTVGQKKKRPFFPACGTRRLKYRLRKCLLACPCFECYRTAQTKRHLIWNRLISFFPELIKNRSLTWRKSLSGRTCTLINAKQLRDSNHEARSGPPTQCRDQEAPTLGFSLRGKPHLSVTRVDRSCRSPGSKSWDTFRPSLSQAFRNTFTLSCRSKWHRLMRLFGFRRLLPPCFWVWLTESLVVAV